MQMRVVLPQLEIYKIEREFANVPHAHANQFQVTIPLHGTCFFTHENKEMALTAGNGLVLQPRDMHSFTMGDDTGLIIIQVNDQSMYPTAMKTRREPSLYQHFDPVTLSDYFKKWMMDMISFDSAHGLAVEELECQILSYLHQTLWGQAGTMETVHDRLVVDPHLKRVLDYIHAHYTEQMNIDELATIALQSRFHFIRSFKSMMGVTPYQYVLQLRVEQAKVQLQRTDDTVTGISYRLGFSSTSQFYRTFLRAVGMTPEKYRAETR